MIDPLGLFKLPSDPSGLPNEWKYDPSHRYPYGERYRSPHGDILDYHKPRAGGNNDGGGGNGKKWQEKPHWHLNEGKKHYLPGQECPTSYGDPILPFTPFPFFLPAPTGIPATPTLGNGNLKVSHF